MTRRLATWRLNILLLSVITLSGCGKVSNTSSPIFFEFKQQPGDKYIYKIKDEVYWNVQYPDGKVYTWKHLQEQKSVMKFVSVDSNAVRQVHLIFIVTVDTTLSEGELPWKRHRHPKDYRFEYQLQMRPNGEIVSVESPDPSSTFFYNWGYRPSQPVFPVEAIAPNYTWTTKFQVNVPKGAPALITSHYRFRDYARIGDFECAAIEFQGELKYTEIMDSPTLREYHCQTFSQGELYFAYREGFVVKKVNLITSFANTGVTKGDKLEIQSRTEMRDHETIMLADIYRSSGEKITYDIKQK